jgi:hypothetical protein
MDFLKLKELKNDKELLELKELAYKHYHYELEQYYFLSNMKSQLKNYTTSYDCKDIDITLHNHINLILKEKELLNIKHDFLNNNPANFDQMTYYKLILCSYYLSFCWYIPLLQLYNYYYYSSLQNNKVNIDVFIGKIRKLYENDTEDQWQIFESEIIEKYKK